MAPVCRAFSAAAQARRLTAHMPQRVEADKFEHRRFRGRASW
jgi:hypothetical protein